MRKTVGLMNSSIEDRAQFAKRKPVQAALRKRGFKRGGCGRSHGGTPGVRIAECGMKGSSMFDF